VLRKQGRAAEAAECYGKITLLQPELAEAHWNLGAFVADQGRLEDAVIHFRRALACRPDFVEAQHSLCMVAYEQGRSAQAIACLRHQRAPRAGGPFRRVNPKPLAGFKSLVRHYEGRA